MKLTLQIQLLPDIKQADQLKATMGRFNQACSWLAEQAFELKVANEMGELTGLRSRPIKTPALTREIGVIEKNGRSLSPTAESFLKTLKTVCKELSRKTD